MHFDTNPNITLGSGTLFMNNELVARTIPEIPPLNLNHPPEYVRSINSPLSAEAEFTMEAEIDAQAYNRLVGFDPAVPFSDATGFSLVYSAPYTEQVRRHKKKRINKKWAKRYGYVTKFKKYRMDEVYFRNPAKEHEYEFYTSNIRVEKAR